MKKRTIAVLLAGMLVLSQLCGCGSGAGEAGETAEAKETASSSVFTGELEEFDHFFDNIRDFPGGLH